MVEQVTDIPRIGTPSGGEEDPITRHHFATASPAEAHRFLRTVYASNRVRLVGRAPNFAFEAGYVQNSISGIEYVDVTDTGHISFLPLRSVFVVQVERGHLLAQAGGVRQSLSRGHLALLGPNVEVDIEWRDVRLSLTRLELDALQQVAATMSDGQQLDLGLRLSRPVGLQQAAHLRATIDYLRRDVYANGAAVGSPLVRHQSFGMVAAAVLNTFPSAFLSRQDQTDTSGLNASAIVRRACAFMDSHAAEDITQADVLRVTRVSARTLQAAFRRFLETTPTAYLTDVRLARAHDDLLEMDRTHGDTVAAVVAKWHFANAGRFAKVYYERFGQSPNATLQM